MANRRPRPKGLSDSLVASAFALRIAPFHYALLIADPRPTH
jgi:hypothetical protein